MWVESLLPDIGKGVVHHRRDGLNALDDAETAAVATLDIIHELQKRLKNGQ